MSNLTTSLNVLINSLYIKRMDEAKAWLNHLPTYFDSNKKVGSEERLELAILFSTLDRTLRKIDKILRN